MEQKDKKIPFPQANDFNKIYKIITLHDESKIFDREYLMEYLNLGTERQISYYLSACEFLGIMSHSRHFTDIGLFIRRLSKDIQILVISKTIISLPVFGEAFFMKYLYKQEYGIKDISILINVFYGIENEEVCNRRASTVLNWIDWINQNKL